VHLIGIDEPKLRAAVAELGADNAFCFTADLTDEEAVRDAIEEGYAHYRQLDVLFSNAGISGAINKIVDYPSDVFHHTLAVHIGGAFHVLKHGLPRLSDGGSVIITSSVVGLMGFRRLVRLCRGQAWPGRSDACRGQGGRWAAYPGEHLHPGPTLPRSRTPSR
jgi:NAD(P)-dependent dehydrogenase (short-subunit alcohol dehydrogenase family)